MKFGIYYAYWEKEWSAEYLPYIERVKKLGFDILELGCGGFDKLPESYFDALREEAARCGVTLTGGYGPSPTHNLASPDPQTVKNGLAFYGNIFPKMQRAGIGSLGGGIYSYWPVDYSGDIDKAGDYQRSVEGMRQLAELAAQYDITLCMEVLNRFEGYLLNDAKEGVQYVRDVGKSNVKVMLDTFHMNIEEDSLTDAIRLAGSALGELHVGEANRKPPQPGRMPWQEIGDALRDIHFDGPVVMEPFVAMGGQVGKDIKVWRPITDDAGDARLDADAAASVAYLRGLFA